MKLRTAGTPGARSGVSSGLVQVIRLVLVRLVWHFGGCLSAGLIATGFFQFSWQTVLMAVLTWGPHSVVLVVAMRTSLRAPQRGLNQLGGFPVQLCTIVAGFGGFSASPIWQPSDFSSF